MSRIGLEPIIVPDNVQVNIDGSQVKVKGPKGELKRTFHRDMNISIDNSVITVSRPTDKRLHRSLHGLTRTLLANMVKGVTEGFEKSLDIVGVGYKAQKVGETVSIQIGYTRPVEVTPPEGVNLQLDNPTRLRVMGIDKEAVGQVAAKLRGIRPPDPYKGKGISYGGERIRRKAGKAGKAGGKKK